MGRKLFRLSAFFPVFLVFFSASLVAQPDGYVEVLPLRGMASDRLGCYRETDGVYDQVKLDDLARDNNCNKLVAGLKADLSKETVIRYSAASDCHMRLVVKVFRVDAERKYKVIVNNIYGGCRAGGWRHGWLVIDKILDGYTVEMNEVKVDRIHGPIRDEGFVFPKPPPIVTSEPLVAREVDTKGCLHMAGASQWVISNPEHLTTAIGNTPDKATCTAHFKKLNIDFEKETLAGYSFVSGYCWRPRGLAFEATKETSTDSAGNRFLLTVSFDKSFGSCHIWRSYPLWVVVPKLPWGYGFGFETKEK